MVTNKEVKPGWYKEELYWCRVTRRHLIWAKAQMELRMLEPMNWVEFGKLVDIDPGYIRHILMEDRTGQGGAIVAERVYRALREFGIMVHLSDFQKSMEPTVPIPPELLNERRQKYQKRARRFDYRQNR